MNFTQTFEIIESSRVFKRFIKENPKAELCAGFFILDLLDKNNQRSLDYKINDKIFTFSLNENNEITFKEDKLIKDPKFPELQKISPNIKIDLNEVPSIAEKTAIENNVKNKFQKIIAVLQIHNNQQVWNLTCILDGFIILNILISSDTGQIIKFDKKTMADFVRRK